MKHRNQNQIEQELQIDLVEIIEEANELRLRIGIAETCVLP